MKIATEFHEIHEIHVILIERKSALVTIGIEQGEGGEGGRGNKRHVSTLDVLELINPLGATWSGTFQAGIFL